MSLNEPYYCTQQINIPPEVMDILKHFTKAAIRTQPKDVLAWSAAYFRAMTKGELPPVTDRVDMPGPINKATTGLTPEILGEMDKVLGSKKQLMVKDVEMAWLERNLPEEQLYDLLRVGNFSGQVVWRRFFALAASALGDSLTEAMTVICEILTTDPPNGPARIPFKIFTELYTFLAKIDGEITQQQISNVINHLQYEVDAQDGLVMPRNFLHSDCPSLA